MKLVLFLLLTVYAYGTDYISVYVMRGDRTVLNWTVSTDYTSYEIEMNVKASSSPSANRLIQRQNTAAGGDSSQVYVTATNLQITIDASSTTNWVAKNYAYDIIARGGGDTTTIFMGTFTVGQDVSSPTDGVETSYPIYIVALDTPNTANTFLVGQDSNNVWYRKTPEQVNSLLSVAASDSDSSDTFIGDADTYVKTDTANDKIIMESDVGIGISSPESDLHIYTNGGNDIFTAEFAANGSDSTLLFRTPGNLGVNTTPNQSGQSPSHRYISLSTPIDNGYSVLELQANDRNSDYYDTIGMLAFLHKDADSTDADFVGFIEMHTDGGQNSSAFNVFTRDESDSIGANGRNVYWRNMKLSIRGTGRYGFNLYPYADSVDALYDFGGNNQNARDLALRDTPTFEGNIVRFRPMTFTDDNTAGSGTASQQAMFGWGVDTLAAENSSVTTTNAFQHYFAGSPVAGTNQTITNSYVLGLDNNDTDVTAGAHLFGFSSNNPMYRFVSSDGDAMELTSGTSDELVLTNASGGFWNTMSNNVAKYYANWTGTTNYGQFLFTENSNTIGSIIALGTAFGTVARRNDMEIWADGDVTLYPANGQKATFTSTGIMFNTGLNYAADAQADDDYEISLPGVSALTAGLTVTFLANTANTDGATLEITEVGDLDAILKMHDQPLATGDIEAGQIVVVVFDGTNWQMTSQIAQ